MGRRQPKQRITTPRYKDRSEGVERRMSYAKTILDKEPEFPKPLEYEDIDAAFTEFAEKVVDLTDPDGKKVPTFTLYSNQRFSEYSQTWEHTDQDGNLLMNFKTVNRMGNPGPGRNQEGHWNIPGDRRYTLLMRNVLSDNGTEHVEVYSMKQPYAVDMSYRITFVTNTYEMLNRFNERVNEMFKSRQCYIRPNGHFVPMVLDEMTDETQYTVEDRKFFTQSANITVMAYIIHAKDFEVKKYAKRVKMHDSVEKGKVVVDIDEPLSVSDFQQVEMNISFSVGETNVTFDMSGELAVTGGRRENIRDLRVSINGTPMYVDKGFRMNDGDTVRMRIFPVDYTKPSKVTLIGHDPTSIPNEAEDVSASVPLVTSVNVD